MKTRDETLADRARYESKAAGALIGLAIGDAMGDVGRSQEHRARYGIVTNMYPEAKSTDDTEFGVLTARALLDSGGELTPESTAAAWRKYVLDRGGAKKRAGRPLYGALANLARGIEPPLSGKHNVMNIDDGAAMRASPHGIYRAGDPDGAAALAAADACVSHDADGIYAAQAIAASVAVAMADGSPDEIVAAGLRFMPAGSWLRAAMDRAMAICDAKPDIEVAYEDLHTILWNPEHASSPEAIPQVYAIFRLTKGDPRRGLLWSANFGRDADTICGLVCSLAGASHGLGAFPEAWAAAVRRPSGVCLEFTADHDMIELGRSLADLSYGKRQDA
ncbi:MAG: ADP-ribosylglycohydrolase family protein [Spirochaetes bacterium]|nr:ADP-ribosylglycohydrolase family protein [Spirochaetota bacterium]MBU1082290.1 ADP-ribosylglycohydrolase family protein [Spirochaetota bacterium]